MEKEKIKELLQSLADAGGTRMVELDNWLDEMKLRELKEKGLIITSNKGYGEALEITILSAGRKFLDEK